jgi:hypothetical protein
MKRAAILQILLTFLIIGTVVQTASGFYKWVDDQGTLHITDYPPPAKYAPKPEPEPVQEPVQKEAPVPAPTPPSVQQVAPPVPPSPPAAVAPSPMPPGRPVPTAPPAAPAMKPAPAGPQTVPAATTPPKTAPGPAAPPPGTPIPISPAPQRQTPATIVPKELVPAAELVGALVGGFMLTIVGIIACLYIFYALCLFKIAKKLNVEGAGAAWVPIVNVFWPVIGAAGKPAWWIILLLVPFVNIIVNIALWMSISENCGKSKWLGLLLLVPLGPLFLWGYLAFSTAE